MLCLYLLLGTAGHTTLKPYKNDVNRQVGA